jgi:hypothetical protein
MMDAPANLDHNQSECVINKSDPTQVNVHMLLGWTVLALCYAIVAESQLHLDEITSALPHQSHMMLLT